ncbi:MAG: N-acyl homoserine lactonase family protein [Gemmatimonadetes bacterium]|nr:N-acyl homoserine lactonase family protein [Gemmatimonadota bacterium]
MRSPALSCLLVLAGCATATRTAAPQYEAFAVKFGALANFRVRGLIAGADSARRIDATLMVWPLRAANGDIIMVDAGFTREKFLTQWKPVDYVTPDSALRRAGFDPARVTDIIISHIHWDHADGVERFPNARIWLQREEFDYYVGPNGEAKAPAIDQEVAAMYRRLFAAGRIRFATGDSAEIRPGIRVHTGGKHTWASQFVSVRTSRGTVVIASDNAYLYENLDQSRPIAQTLDSLSNLRAQRTMRALATSPALVIPGHDPAVMTRFPASGSGAVALRP